MVVLKEQPSNNPETWDFTLLDAPAIDVSAQFQTAESEDRQTTNLLARRHWSQASVD